MDVTCDNFTSSLPLIREKLNACDYFAIDAEMTGLHLNEARKEAIFDDEAMRYARLRESAQNFLIIQFGLSFFKWIPVRKAYEASTFNFYVFPKPYDKQDTRFTCQSSSLQFLCLHKFDFNKFIYQGVPFLSLDALSREERRLSQSDPQRSPIVLTQIEDVAFVARQVVKVRDWIASTEPSTSQEPSRLLLEPSNSFLRASLHQSLTREFGSEHFYIEREYSGPKVSLRLTRSDAEGVADFEARQRQERDRKFQEAAGFGLVVRMLVGCDKPMVGHNLAYDLVYFLNQFVGPLPPSFPQFQEQVKKYFPKGIYDTKHISRQFPAVFSKSGTSLETVFRTVSRIRATAAQLAPAKNSPEPVPQPDLSIENPPHSESSDSLAAVEAVDVYHSDGFDRYAALDAIGESMAHEAGYDAFMTGAAFAGLASLACAQNSRESTAPAGISQLVPYKNRVNVMYSDLPYLSLDTCQPPPDRSNVFFLSEFDSGANSATFLDLFANVGLGPVRLTWVDQQSLYVSLPSAVSRENVAEKLAASGWKGKCTPFGDIERDGQLDSDASKARGRKRAREDGVGSVRNNDNSCSIL